MKKAQIHGVMSLGLILVSMVIAAVAMFLASWKLGIAYLAICVIAQGAIIYGFCAKCPCKEHHCGHVFPGKIASLFSREPGPYTTLELGVLIVALVLLMGFPLPWLWKVFPLFVTFLVLNVIALTEILTCVCQVCDNVHCPVKVFKGKQL